MARECRRCSGGSAGPRDLAAGPLSGWRLALVAAVTFLGPVGLAIAGGLLARPAGIGRNLGAGAGLAAGLVFGVWAARMLARLFKGAE